MSTDGLCTKTSAPNLLSYALVADQNTSAVGGTVTIRGSAYLGMYGADFNTVNVNVSPVGKGNLITGGELYVHNGATLESKMHRHGRMRYR